MWLAKLTLTRFTYLLSSYSVVYANGAKSTSPSSASPGPSTSSQTHIGGREKLCITKAILTHSSIAQAPVSLSVLWDTLTRVVTQICVAISLAESGPQASEYMTI